MNITEKKTPVVTLFEVADPSGIAFEYFSTRQDKFVVGKFRFERTTITDSLYHSVKECIEAFIIFVEIECAILLHHPVDVENL